MFPKIPVIASPANMVGHSLVSLSDPDGSGSNMSQLHAWVSYRTSNDPACPESFPTRVVYSGGLPIFRGEYNRPTQIGNDFLGGAIKVVRLPPQDQAFALMRGAVYINLDGGLIGYSSSPPQGHDFIGCIGSAFVLDDFTLTSAVADTQDLSSIGITDLDSLVLCPYLAISPYGGYYNTKATWGGVNGSGQLAALATMNGTPAVISNVKRLLAWAVPVASGSFVLYLDTSNTIRLSGTAADYSGLDGTAVQLIATGCVQAYQTINPFVYVVYTDTSGGLHAWSASNKQTFDIPLANGEAVVSMSDGGMYSPTIVTNQASYTIEHGDLPPYTPILHAGALPASPPPGVSETNFFGGSAYLDGTAVRGAAASYTNGAFALTEQVLRLSDDADNLTITLSINDFSGELTALDALDARFDVRSNGALPPLYLGGKDYASGCDPQEWPKLTFSAKRSIGDVYKDIAVSFKGHHRARYLLAVPYRTGGGAT